MGDSDSKKFGDSFVDKLRGQLDRKPPLFNKSLFAGAGDATKNAWGAATGNANDIIASGGLTPEQRAALSTFGDVNAGYGAAAERARAALMPVGAGYRSIAADGGLTPEQRAAMARTGAIGSDYADLGDAYSAEGPGYARLRSKVADDTLTDVASLFASNGRYGSDVMAEGVSEGLADALAGLDYANFQNDIDNRYRSLDAERGTVGDTFAMSQAGTGNRLAGLGGEADIASQIFGTDAAALAGRQNAASAQFAGGQQGLDNRTAAIDALTGVGAARDANRQGKLLGDADLYDRTKNAELDWLQKIGTVFGDPTAAANQTSWWEQMLGSLAGAAGRAIGGTIT